MRPLIALKLITFKKLRGSDPTLPFLAAAFLTLAACGGLIEDSRSVLERAAPHAVMPRSHTVDDSDFDTVWPAVIEVLEERGYEDLESNRGSEEKTYTYTVDRRTGEEKSETVTERYGSVVASAEEDRFVHLEVRERHRWGTSTVDLLHAVARTIDDDDERDRRTLMDDGIEIRIPEESLLAHSPEEADAIFRDLAERLDG